MEFGYEPLSADLLILTRELIIAGERTAFYSAAHRGDFARVVRGVYAPTEMWSALRQVGQHRTRVRAMSLLDPEIVFSHVSAALEWRLPLVGPPPGRPEAIALSGSGADSSRAVTIHTTAIAPEWVDIDGIRVTDFGRTLLDVARALPMERSVPMLDFALRPRINGEGWPASVRSDRGELLERLRLFSHVGMARAEAAIRFADGASGSPGESKSRVIMWRIGLPRPVLQEVFRDAHGFAGRVDFYLEGDDVIGEFDGHGKYLREELRPGQTSGDVVVEEKVREDRLRRLVRGFVRWGWDDLTPARLRARFAVVGVRSAKLGLRK